MLGFANEFMACAPNLLAFYAPTKFLRDTISFAEIHMLEQVGACL